MFIFPTTPSERKLSITQCLVSTKIFSPTCRKEYLNTYRVSQSMPMDLYGGHIMTPYGYMYDPLACIILNNVWCSYDWRCVLKKNLSCDCESKCFLERFRLLSLLQNYRLMSTTISCVIIYKRTKNSKT